MIIGYIQFQISVLLQSCISWITFAQLRSTLGSCVVLSGHYTMVCFLEQRSAMASSQVEGLEVVVMQCSLFCISFVSVRVLFQEIFDCCLSVWMTC